MSVTFWCVEAERALGLSSEALRGFRHLFKTHVWLKMGRSPGGAARI